MLQLRINKSINGMKFLYLLIYFVGPILGKLGSSYVGEFKTVLESIDNRDDMNRTMADWHITMRRKTRNEKVVDGYFVLKKTIIKPWVEFETLVWAGGKFIKMAIDQLTKLSICDDDIKNNFYYPVFEGNVTWSNDCVLTPGLMRFRKDKDFDVDGLVHKVLNETFYGTFQIKATVYMLKKDKKLKDMVKTTIGGITVVIRTEKK